ncbi:MAG: hypothetical protein ACK4TA_17490 [Saprospiraceae bacterium]
MKGHIRSSILTIWLLIFMSYLWAQNEGIFHYEIETFFPGSKVSMSVQQGMILFNPHFSRVEQRENNRTIGIIDNKRQEGYSYLQDLSVMVIFKPLENLTILYPGETKQILGYNCRKGIATGEGFTTEFYVTDEIKATCTPTALLGWVEGFVLEYKSPSVHFRPLNLALEPIDPTLFYVPALRVTTKEEVVEMMKGRKR